MKQLHDVMRGVPGGWRYTDPDTGNKTIAGCFIDLVDKAVEHRITNGLPIPLNMSELIEDQLCSQIKPSFWHERETVAAKPDDLHAMTVNQKVEALNRAFKSYGSITVPATVATERSKVCRFCSCNKPTSCLSCNGVYDWLCKKFNLPALPDDDYLHSCSVDRVYNKAQVHLTVEVFASKVGQAHLSRYPESCWKRKLLEAHYAESQP
jgi:hypothetical protein